MQVLDLRDVDGLKCRAAGLELGLGQRRPPSDVELLLGDLAREQAT